MRRRDFITGIAGSVAGWPLSVRAQQRAKVAHIGYLGLVSASWHTPRVTAFRAGLRDLGYAEGKDIVAEFRWAEGRYDQLPALVAELVGLNVDVIVTHGVRATKAAVCGAMRNCSSRTHGIWICSCTDIRTWPRSRKCRVVESSRMPARGSMRRHFSG